MGVSQNYKEFREKIESGFDAVGMLFRLMRKLLHAGRDEFLEDTLQCVHDDRPPFSWSGGLSITPRAADCKLNFNPKLGAADFATTGDLLKRYLSIYCIGDIYPSCIAFVTASTVEETSSFSKMCCKWFDSVLSLIYNSSAILFRFLPLQTSCKMFFSILVRSSIIISVLSDGKQVML